MKLKWDQIGEHFYETGVKNGVLFVTNANGSYDKGVAWNGLSSVSQSPSGAEATAVWADNIKYLNLISAEEFGGTIEAYTFPDEFSLCDGGANIAEGVVVGQQGRRAFGFSYQSVVGNDTDNNDYGYKIHLIYNALATPSEKQHQTINDSPEAATLSWEFSTTPVTLSSINPLTGKVYKPTSLITIDSTKVNAEKLADFEAILYGTDPGEDPSTTPGTEPRLMTPDEVFAFFA